MIVFVIFSEFIVNFEIPENNVAEVKPTIFRVLVSSHNINEFLEVFLNLSSFLFCIEVDIERIQNILHPIHICIHLTTSLYQVELYYIP